MKIGGSTGGPYGKKVQEYISQSRYKKDIEVLGKVSDELKSELMQKSHVILVTSVEEGWGLIVSEANGQGTPAVVYNVSGLRDSVRNGETGIVTDVNPASLAAETIGLLKKPEKYERLRLNGWKWSKDLIFDASYRDFKKVVGLSQ